MDNKVPTFCAKCKKLYHRTQYSEEIEFAKKTKNKKTKVIGLLICDECADPHSPRLRRHY